MRTALLVVLAAGLACGAWWALNLGGGEAGLTVDPDAPATPPETGPVLEGSLRAAGAASRALQGRGHLQGLVLAGAQPRAARVRVLLQRATSPATPLPRPRGAGQLREFTFFQPPRAPVEVAAAEAGADGVFRVTGLAPGAYRVEAEAADGSRGMAWVLLAAEPPMARTTVRLAPPHAAFEGSVRWEDGAPFEGTLVATTAVSDHEEAFAARGLDGIAVALDAGRFRVEGLGEGLVSVRAFDMSGSLLVAGPRAALPQSEPYNLVVRRATREVAGRVLIAGEDTPIAGADVVASAHQGMGALAAGVPVSPRVLLSTDAEGRFRAPLPAGRVFLRAQARGFREGSLSPEVEATEHLLRLLRCGGVRGRVTSLADGTPAAGARVCAMAADRTSAEAWTDASGRYTLEHVSPGEARVFVRGGGWVSPELASLPRDGFDPLALEVLAGADTTFDLRALPAGALVGRVLGPEGQGVAGATLQPLSDPRGRGFDPLSEPGVGGMPTLSSDDGAFRIEDLLPGSLLYVEVRSGAFPTLRSGPHGVATASGAPVEIHLEAPRWLDVTVRVGETDRPAGGAVVSSMRSVRQGGMRSGLRAADVTTDAQGRARLGPLGAGELHVWARPAPSGSASFTSPQVQVTIPSEGSPAPLTLSLPAARSLTGRVELPDGTPAEGATVHEARASSGATSDARGAFRLDVPEGTPVTLTAQHVVPGAGRLQARASLGASANEVVLRLARGDGAHELVVHVSDANGMPVHFASVRVVAAPPGGGSSSVGSTLQQGTARFDLDPERNSTMTQALATGQAFVEVSLARGSDEQPLPLGPVRYGPLGATERVVRIVLPSERTLVGRVLAPDDAPVRGALVRARPVQGDEPSRSGSSSEFQAQARTDGRGAFLLRGLGEGDYQLDVLGPRHLIVPPLEPVRAGGADVVVRLLAGRSARVLVLDEAGRPLQGCSVSARPADDTPRRADSSSVQATQSTTGVDGVARLEGLPAEGALTLLVQGPSGEERYTAHNAASWVPADTEVRLVRAYSVAGIVSDAAGRPAEGVVVYRRTEAGAWNGTTTDARGRFTLDDVPPGPIPLRVAIGGDSSWMQDGAPETVVRAGTQDVRLTVDPGLTLDVRLAPSELARYPFFALLRAQGSAGEQDIHDMGGTPGAAHLLRFGGLKPDVAYALWIAPQEGSEWYVWSPDLRGGTAVEARFERGATIRGRVVLPGGMPPGMEYAHVQAHDALGRHIGTKIAADGGFTLRGLPPGRFKVTARAQKDDRAWSAEVADVLPGADVELHLAEQPTR